MLHLKHNADGAMARNASLRKQHGLSEQNADIMHTLVFQ